MPSGEEAYTAWAPEGARWSAWVKPVLFATLPSNPGDVTWPEVDVGWAPPARREPEVKASEEGYRDGAEVKPALPGETAIVLELPAARALAAGLALAAAGYRPVPVIASAPSPFASPGLVDTRMAQAMLASATPRLLGLGLPADAPPAFVLDADRMPGRSASPGSFDNRSLLFAQDFPSASHLRAAGITRALVCAAMRPGEDLWHVLCRWRDAGLVVETTGPDGRGREPFGEPAPSGYRSLMQRAAAIFGLRRNPAGGFGALVPVPSQGGG